MKTALNLFMIAGMLQVEHAMGVYMPNSTNQVVYHPSVEMKIDADDLSDGVEYNSPGLDLRDSSTISKNTGVKINFKAGFKNNRQLDAIKLQEPIVKIVLPKTIKVEIEPKIGQVADVVQILDDNDKKILHDDAWPEQMSENISESNSIDVQPALSGRLVLAQLPSEDGNLLKAKTEDDTSVDQQSDKSDATQPTEDKSDDKSANAPKSFVGQGTIKVDMSAASINRAYASVDAGLRANKQELASIQSNKPKTYRRWYEQVGDALLVNNVNN